jgi:predicted nucleic acid-binding Zn ribbon protein
VPSYDYECPGEGIKMTLTLPFDHEQPVCLCGELMERIYTAPAVKFKGSGFYSTGG